MSLTAGASSTRLLDEVPNPGVEDFRERARAAIDAHVMPRIERAEQERRFPSHALRALAQEGLLRERWRSGDDLLRGIVLAEELGYSGAGGVAVGIGVHAEAATSILHRFRDQPLASAAYEDALSGRRIACLATSEQKSGSDLMGVSCVAHRVADDWRVSGRKRYVSLGACCDMALVLCAAHEDSRSRGLTTVLVPREFLRVVHRWNPVGMHSLETVELSIDGVLPGDAVIGRPGAGLLVTSWGLSHERLMGSAMALGGMALVLDLGLERLHRRHQFGVPLIRHQALRLRLAELVSQVHLARYGVWGFAASIAKIEPRHIRRIAGIKATVSRLAERVASECMHLFGGEGYMEDTSPLARLWRDARFARVGGGTDEAMWELVAGGLAGPRDIPHEDSTAILPPNPEPGRRLDNPSGDARTGRPA